MLVGRSDCLPGASRWTVSSTHTHAHAHTGDNGYTILNYNKHSSRNEYVFPEIIQVIYCTHAIANDRMKRCLKDGRTHLMLWWCPTLPICGLRYSSKAEPRCSRLPARSRALRSDGWLPGGSGGTDLPDGVYVFMLGMVSCTDRLEQCGRHTHSRRSMMGLIVGRRSAVVAVRR